jgi:methylthioribose-1-phosphate isomerase
MTDAVSPSSDLPNLILNAATFVASITAVYFTHRSLRLGSKQKLADFRKEWIESLRTDIADLLAKDTTMLNCVMQLDDLKTATKNAEDSEFAKRLLSESVEIVKQREIAKADRLSSYGSILLKLNDEEAENGELVKAIKAVLIANKLPESEMARSLVIQKARALFKKEWTKLNSELET